MKPCLGFFFAVFFALIVVMFSGAQVAAAPVMINHTSVDLYDDIPQFYIDEVKKMLLSYPGESHGTGLFYGLELLEQQDSKFAVSATWTGQSEAQTDQHLRILRSYYDGDAFWSTSGGEEDTWTALAAVQMMNNHFAYNRDTLGNNIDAFAFGWCWDMGGSNPPGGVTDPVYNVRWAGRSFTLGGVDQGRWGLDDGDTALTGNPLGINMNDYVEAWDNYSQTNPNTTVIYTTGPADYSGENGYQVYLKNEYIRDWVRNSINGYLFDYADITSYNDAGIQYTIVWNGHTFPNLHPDNDEEYDCSTDCADGGHGSCHISKNATIMLGKAMWVLLAMKAGWDGIPGCTDGDGDGYNTTSSEGCGSPADVDCNDGNPNIHPGATELCNGVDDNCVGGIDEGACPSCGEGEITQRCDCGGLIYNPGSGYCCSNVFQVTECGLGNYYDSFDNGLGIAEYSIGVVIGGGVVSFSSGGPSDYSSDPNLVSIYLFGDPVPGIMGIDSKGSNHMTNYIGGDPAQSTAVPSGFSGSSIELDGDDTICTATGTSFDAPQDHTLCWWANPSSLGTHRNQFAQMSIYDTWPSVSNDNYRWATNTVTIGWHQLDIFNVYAQNTWVHICNRYDNSELNKSVFINGAFAGSDVILSDIISSTTRWCIGSYGGGGFFYGNIYRPMWFNRTLSDAEISALYSGTYFGSGAGSGNFTSVLIPVAGNITEIMSVNWTESNTDVNNNITVQVSVDDGLNWYYVNNYQGLTGFTPGDQLVYRVFFNVVDRTISMDDISITWTEGEDGNMPSYLTFNGSTTDFDSVADITQVPDAVLEKAGLGKINFSGQTLDFSGLDLDNHITIQNNRVGFDNTVLPGLNVQAILTIHGSFSDPKILEDGAECYTVGSHCNITEHTPSRVTFTVDHFSYFSVGITGAAGAPGFELNIITLIIAVVLASAVLFAANRKI